MENPEQEPFDLDEDLFAFDEVARELSAEAERDEDLEEIFASHRGEELHEYEEELAGAPGATETELVEAADLAAELDSEPEPVAEYERPARPVTPRAAPATPARAAARASAPRTSDADLEPEPETVTPAPRRFPRLPRGMVAIALSVTLLNGLLGVVLLHGNARMRDEVRAVGNEADAADSDVARSGTPSADPDGLFDAEAHPAFVEARDEIARGEYAAARQRIYALLAIIDRLEDPRREAVEAEAQFVLAQTLHLEALERMGTSR